ncbi:MAG: response regulator [Alphaproteobacteria bacterium]|jgi:DNA-binding response OmpR family regulator|nr:response regulator [Alphaproteobacteria bacterium]
MTIRILIVEDEFLQAELIAHTLASRGYEIVGPFRRLEAAVAAAGREAIDVALLDINIDGQLIYPVADQLFDRDIPYAFISANDNAVLAPERHKRAASLRKPYDPEDLGGLVARLLDRGG